MPITRTFLDWTSPLLPQAAQQLWEMGVRSDDGGIICDLSHVIVVIPGQRAANRMNELLLEQADLAHGDSDNHRTPVINPPQIATPGSLPECLYRPQRAFASAVVQQLAWMQAMQRLPTASLADLISDPPAFDRRDFWFDIGRLLSDLSRELGNEAMSVRDVYHSMASAESSPDLARWKVLASLQDAYHDILDELNLWDRQAARRYAIKESTTEIETKKQIVLIATTDLSNAIRLMIDIVSKSTDVQSWIFADPGLADQFDQYGCVISDTWQRTPIEIPTESLILADGPSEQAQWTANCFLQTLSPGSRSASSNEQAGESSTRDGTATVCIADSSLVPDVQRSLSENGIASRWLGGQSVRLSLPYLLLEAVAKYLNGSRYADFSNLVRHPDVKSWLESHRPDNGWLAELDQIQNARLPLYLYVRPNAAADSRLEQADDALPFFKAKIGQWLAGLSATTASWQDRWEQIRALLLQVYADTEVDRNSPNGRLTYECLASINALLSDLEGMPQPLQFSLTGAEAVQFVVSQIADLAIGVPSQPDELELVGWLDGAWDDTESIIVCGMNEGVVPKAEQTDLFLPDHLRAQLNLLDNARRYARDAYALRLLSASKTNLRIVFGKRDIESNPLTPSRLLFAVDESKIAQRAKDLFGAPAAPHEPAQETGGDALSTGGTAHDESTHDRQNETNIEPANESRFGGLAIPRPHDDVPVLSELSVTRFSSYLQCPYRFYLSHVMRLTSIDDQAEEIDGGTFGTIVHDVLDRFGKSKLRHSTSAEEIDDYLMRRLDDELKHRFDANCLPSVSIQSIQLRQRLKIFAERQAARSQDGWRIWDTEIKSLKHEWEVDGMPFTITGRIDRIDRHEKDGRFALLDYKTSDRGDSPEDSHRKRGEWFDLQLPLYRRIARQVPEIGTELELGYFLLPKDTGQVGISMADWSEADLDDADQRAIDVIRSLRERVFWPPADLPGRWTDPLGAICQTRVFGRDLDDQQDGKSGSGDGEESASHG